MNDDDRDLGSHPDLDELAAYHAGALSPADEHRIQDHLVLCRECSTTLLDLARFADPAGDDGAGLPAGLGEAVWQGVAPHLRAPRKTGNVVPFPARAPEPRVAPRRRLRALRALAAALLVATIGLSAWVVSLRRTVGELSRPQADEPVVDLYSGTVRGDGAPRPPVTVKAGVQRFTVILNPRGQRDAAGYRAEVTRTGDGAVVVPKTPLQLNAYGSLSLGLTRHDLGPGDFQVRLFAAAQDGKETQIGEYALRVASP